MKLNLRPKQAKTPALSAVVECIIQSERNLRAAEAAYKEWENAREAILQRFFARVGAHLEKSLPGWKTKYDSKFFLDEWGAFSLFKPSWRGEYEVRIECGEYGERKMAIGIWREEEIVAPRPRSPQLLSALEDELPGAKDRKYWDVIAVMHSPAEDWRPIEVLWQIHSQQSVQKDVSAHMLHIARVTERIIDKLVVQYAKK